MGWRLSQLYAQPMSVSANIITTAAFGIWP
jgi:hypothetical protein